MNLPALLTRCRDFVAEEHRVTLDCATGPDGTLDDDAFTQEALLEMQALLSDLDAAIAELTRQANGVRS